MGAHISHGETHLNTEEVLARILAYFESHGLRAADVFALLDLDKSGFVSFDEFVQGVQLCIDGTHVAPALTRENLWVVFCRFDEDRDGKLSVQDFISHLRPADYNGSRPTLWIASPMERPEGLPLPQPQSYSAGPPPFRRDDVVLRIARAVVRAGKAPMDLFEAVDANRDGQLSRMELEQALRGFQPDLTAMELAVIFETFDADHSGTVSAHEFCTALDRLSPGAFVAVEKKVEHLGLKFRQQGLSFYDAFRVFDRDGDGALTREEWQRASRHLAPELTQDGVEAIFRRFDADGDGLMSLGEFSTFFELSVGHHSPAVVPHALEHGVCTPQRAVETAPYIVERAPTWQNCGLEQFSVQPLQPLEAYSSMPVSYLQQEVPSSFPPVITNTGTTHEATYPVTPVCYIQPTQPIQTEPRNVMAPTLLTNRAAVLESVAEKGRPMDPWEKDVLDTIKSCLSFPRSGFRLHEAFERLNTSKSGYLDSYEFDRMATAYYPELHPQQLRNLFATVNMSGSGRITYDEFSRRFAAEW